MITPANLSKHELIGREVRVVDATDKALIGATGQVVDETRNTITIEAKGRQKQLIKDQCTFSFHLPSGKWVKVEGKILVARPEDRIKKKQKKW